MRSFTAALFPFLMLAAAFWAFSPGLSGGFLFDDLVNLPALGEYGGVRDLQSLSLYLTSGLGDPLGRPIALLSFLIDARTWPAQPAPFLRTNLIIHLFNGVLLVAVLQNLGKATGTNRNANQFAAVAAAACWLLHPLQLSTTLYIVQREAMLAATCTLLAFLAWLRGRQLFVSPSTRRAGLRWLIVGAWGCTFVGALCKANGLLIPLLLATAEFTVLNVSTVSTDTSFIRARRFLIGVPAVALIAGLLAALPQFVQTAHDVRAWSLAQRLFTEPRALWYYVELLILPRPLSRGVFHDEFAASTTLFSPPSTLLALLALAGIVAFAVAYRKRWPSISFAILFFLVGHLLESTFIPLELYFEHRNYLPSLVLFWPLGRWLTSPTQPLKKFRIGTVFFLLALFAFDTHVGAEFWGNPSRLALEWAARNADSARAQAYAAQFEIANREISAARRRLSLALHNHPDEPQLAFNLIDAECTNGTVAPSILTSTEEAVKANASAAALDFNWIAAAIPRASSGNCENFNIDALERIVAAARVNRKFADAPGRIQDFDHLQGLIALSEGDADSAFTSFEASVHVLPGLPIAIEQAALLGNANRPDLGLRHLDEYLALHPLEHSKFGVSAQSLHAWLLDKFGYWQNEINRVQSLLENASMRDSATPS